MQTHSLWLHAIRKRVITEEKKRGLKNMKMRNCFRKYTIEDNHVA